MMFRMWKAFEKCGLGCELLFCVMSVGWKTGMTDEKWNDIQQNIKSLIGQNNYVNWISPLGFNGVFDGVALFDVPTNFLGY